MPNTLEENVNRVKAAKTAIANAITAKGGTVASGDGLEDFASDIATIPSGGSVKLFGNNEQCRPLTTKLTSSSWVSKSWTGLNDFSYLWTDGDNIYCSNGNYQYVLDKSTSTWSVKTWRGATGFYASELWTDGDNIYYSTGSGYKYVLDKSTSIWSVKTWSGAPQDWLSVYVWTDGDNFYYSNGTAQYVIDIQTSTWSTKTWTGLTSFIGNNIWTDGDNIYYSNGTAQYVLGIETNLKPLPSTKTR